jgi:hypothetical protein
MKARTATVHGQQTPAEEVFFPAVDWVGGRSSSEEPHSVICLPPMMNFLGEKRSGQANPGDKIRACWPG